MRPQRGSYQCLREHPEVFVSEEKELEFFNRHFEKGIAWYEQHFTPQPQHKAVGEITPIYLSHECAVGRMAAIIPDARLFVVLREPVARAYSAFELHRERFSGSFREACEQRPDYLIDWGCYARHLRRVYAHYDESQVAVYLYEELQDQPHRFLSQLFEFLRVDSHFRPKHIQIRYNRMMYPRTQRLLRSIGIGWAVDFIKDTQVGKWIRNRHVAQRPSPFAAIDQEDANWLKLQFRDDVLELQQLIGRNLTSWL